MQFGTLLRSDAPLSVVMQGTPVSEPEPVSHKQELRSSNASLRILFLLPNSNEFGGLERHLLQLTDKLLESNAQITVICFGPDLISERLTHKCSARVTVWERKEPQSLFRWTMLIRSARPDVIVFCYGWILSFSWQAILASVLTGIRKRVAIQHLVLPPIPAPYSRGGLYGALRRRLGERARRLYSWRIAGLLCTKTICVSDAVKASLISTVRFSPRKTITIRNGVPTSVFAPNGANRVYVRERFGIDPEEFLLVCTARLSKVKGVDILLQALARVLQQGIRCKCIILGDGPLRDELVGLAERLGLNKAVLFEGFQKDVRPYLQAGSAFILTSHTEGLPLSVLEAMACGLPCIVTNVGGTAEAVENEVTGLVIAPASQTEVEAAIARLATRPWECREMGSRARETVCRRFDLDHQMTEIGNVLLN